MSVSLEDVKNTLTKIKNGKNMMSYLYEFERTLEMTGVIHFKNWYKGELVKGPKIEKYWVTCSFMYPHSDMPDPDAALRLKKIGCIVGFEKKVLRRPVKVLSQEDWSDFSTKKAKIEKVDVWVVTIKMPMKYINDNYDDVNSFLDDLDTDYNMSDSLSDNYSDSDMSDEGDSYSNFTGGSRI